MDYYSAKYFTTSMVVNGSYRTTYNGVPLRNISDDRLLYHKAAIFDCPRKFKSPTNFGKVDDNIKATSWKEAINWKSNSLSTNSASSSECNLSSFKSNSNSELDFSDVISVPPSLPSPTYSDRSSFGSSGRGRSRRNWSLYKEINPTQKRISPPIQKKIEILKKSQNHNLKRTGSWLKLAGRNSNEKIIENLNMKQVHFTVKEKDSSYVEDLENHKHFVNETKCLFESKIDHSNKINKQSIDCPSSEGEITAVKCKTSYLPSSSYSLIKPKNDVPKSQTSPKDSKTKPVQPLMGTNALLPPNKVNPKMDQQNTNDDGEIVRNILLNNFKQPTLRRNWEKSIGNKTNGVLANTENKNCENSNVEKHLERISENKKDHEKTERIYAQITKTQKSGNKQITQINFENVGKNSFQLEKSIVNEARTLKDDENNNGIFTQRKSTVQTTPGNKRSIEINGLENSIQLGKVGNSTPNANDVKIISNMTKDDGTEPIYSTIPDTYEHHIYEVMPNDFKNTEPAQMISQNISSIQPTEIKKTNDAKVSNSTLKSLVDKKSGVKFIAKNEELSDSEIHFNADHSIIKSESISTLFSSSGDLSFNSQLFLKEAGVLDIDVSDAELNAETHKIDETFSVSADSIKTMDASDLIDSKVFRCTFDKKKKGSDSNIVTSTPNDDSKFNGFYNMFSNKIVHSMINRKKKTLSSRRKAIKPIKTSFTICANLNDLWNEYNVEKERLIQVYKGLALCYSSKQFSISDAQIEFEKCLLTTGLRLQSIENEFRKIDYEMRSAVKKPKYTGTLELSNITVPLKAERAEKLLEVNSMTQWFTCVVSSGTQVYSSQAVKADYDGIIRFQNDKSNFTATVNKLNPDFVVTIEIYSCKQRNPQSILNESSQKMECLSPLTFKKFKKTKTLKRFPSILNNNNDYYSTAELKFKTTGKVEIRLNNLTKKNSRMLLPVPLSSSIDGTINFDLKSSVEIADSTTSQEGFVNFGIVNNTTISWDKQWCRLDGHTLKFWNYPSLQHEEPRYMVDLSFCASPARPVDRQFCSKLRTILIETTIVSKNNNNEEDGQKYMISTDTLAEFMEWIKHLNEIITTLIKWKVC